MSSVSPTVNLFWWLLIIINYNNIDDDDGLDDGNDDDDDRSYGQNDENRLEDVSNEL